MTSTRRAAKTELGDKALSGLHGVFEALMTRDPQGTAQQRRRTAHLWCDRAKRRDPSPGIPLIGAQLLRPDIRLPPREAPLANQEERVGEVVKRGTKLLDGETVWRSLKPNRRARSSCESLRSSRNALIRAPIKFDVMAASADPYSLADKRLQDYLALVGSSRSAVEPWRFQ